VDIPEEIKPLGTVGSRLESQLWRKPDFPDKGFVNHVVAIRGKKMQPSERVCLIVDDDPIVRTYLSNILKREGIRSIEGNDGVHALGILKQPGTHIDLLITDIEMPGGIDGLDLAISAALWFPTLPIIVVSGGSRTAPAGFTFVHKPYMPDAIRNAIEEVTTRSAVGNGTQTINDTQVSYGD